MLCNLCGLRKTKPSLSHRDEPPPEDPHHRPLRIVHAGGFVESYYTAVPALKIMERYPQAVLTRPDVFRKPWESTVRPEEILNPGEKFYVVPRRTLQNLRRQKPQQRAFSTCRNGTVKQEGCITKRTTVLPLYTPMKRDPTTAEEERLESLTFNLNMVSLL